jgi:hypothetical protein
VIPRHIHLPEPELVELGGQPEMFCDVAIVRNFGETVRVLLCRETTPGGSRAEVTGMV